jgi:hypothetical protein
MAKMGFLVQGVGVGGFSGGKLLLAFQNGANRALYEGGRGIVVQGTSSAAIRSTFTITIPDDPQLDKLDARVVHFTLEGSLFGIGTIPMVFEAFNNDDNDPFYKVSRRPTAAGVLIGDVKIMTRVAQRPISRDPPPWYYMGGNGEKDAYLNFINLI